MRPGRWQSPVWSALTALLVAAVVARVTWELLRPMLPALLVAVVLVGVLRLAAGRYRQW